VTDRLIDEASVEFEWDANVVRADLETVPEPFHMFKIPSTPAFFVLEPKTAGIHQRWRRSSLVLEDFLVDLRKAVDATCPEHP
jgi:hypothetical protein